MITLKIDVADVHQRTGPRAARLEFREELGPRVISGDSFALLITWARIWKASDLEGERSYLSLRAAHGEPPAPFASGRADLEAAYDDLRIPPDRRDFRFLEGRHFLVALVRRGATITLEPRVDTDDDAFCIRAGLAAGPEGLAEELEAFLFNDQGLERRRIQLNLRPATAVPDSQDFVAVDPGHHSGCLACLLGGRRGTSDLRVLSFGEQGWAMKPGDATVRAAVRLHTLAPDGEAHAGTSWGVGEAALKGEGELVLGATGLATSPEWEEERQVRLPKPARVGGEGPGRHGSHKSECKVRNRLWLELFLCDLLKGFRHATRSRPRHLAMIYPMFFLRRQLKQLRETLYRAFLRMRVSRQDNVPEGSRVHIPLAIDAATAAAYFHIYRMAFEGPGGLPRFRYEYPRGFNLLVIDCGADSSSLAVVSAVSKSDNPTRLSIRVRGRSGTRRLSGDLITTVVFRLLKAKIAAKVEAPAGRGPRLTLPVAREDAAALRTFLEENEAVIDSRVPTRFDPAVADERQGANRVHTLDLWGASEAVKAALENDPATCVLPEDSRLLRYLARNWSGPGGPAALATALKKIEVQRWEADALLGDAVAHCVDQSNRLIRERLTAQGEECHAVAIAGQAARYPLVGKVLREGLDISFLDEGRFLYDPDHLKTTAAAGAALALETHRAEGAAEIDLDVDLCERLPYDVAFWDLAANEARILFREGEHYDRLKSQQVAVRAPDGKGVGLRALVLQRRWPGDEGFSPYLQFNFEKDVQGPVTLEYNPESDFAAKDDSGAVGQACELFDSRMYCSPAQRGDL